MNFNHKFGCLKCCTIGEYDNDAHVMCFPDIKAERRTDETFRSMAQQQHHHMKSPLEDLDIDMIYTFPSSDPLHLLELGVMKKCLLRWNGKTKPFKGKWKKIPSNQYHNIFSNAMNSCQQTFTALFGV